MPAPFATRFLVRAFRLTLAGGFAMVALSSCALLSPRERTVVFFGDSLTAGYGLAHPEAEAFPALIQQKLAAENLHWQVVNAGRNGDTTAGGESRLDEILAYPVGIFVLELGGNDGLSGLPLAAVRQRLQAIIGKVRARHPAARFVVAGMRVPDSARSGYARDFAAIYPTLAEANHAALVPWLLEGVADVPSLNQADGTHPNAAGHVIMAEQVWQALRPLLRR